MRGTAEPNGHFEILPSVVRHGLDAWHLRWAVDIVRNQKVDASDVRLVPPTGHARKPVPDREPREVEAVLAELT